MSQQVIEKQPHTTLHSRRASGANPRTRSSKLRPEAGATLNNQQIAARLDEIADLLMNQRANWFRVRAYRQAADTIRELSEPIHAVFERGGADGLLEIPGIGESLAQLIATLIRTGHLPMLDRLRGEMDPVPVLSSVPGIGRVLARRLSEEAGIHTLEDLELAVHDGRLARRPGFGTKRVEGIRAALQARLGRAAGYDKIPADPPPVTDLLAIDRLYRERAERGELPTIAPHRFNPRHEAWLPIMHDTRASGHYTALYSNTARAHELKATNDWVVIYRDGCRFERPYVVITSTRGPLAGLRIIPGLEEECAQYYESSPRSAEAVAGHSPDSKPAKLMAG